MAEEIDLESILIAPLEKGKTKGAFNIDEKDEEYSNLVNWINCSALQAQREKKSKTYLALYNGKPVAYLTISFGLLDDIPGVNNSTRHELQVLLIGKLYTNPDFRGFGIGRKLMNFALDIAQYLDDLVGCVGMIVDANNNENTVRFYERYGFEKIDENKKERTVQMFFKIIQNP